MVRKIRVLVVDDSLVFRALLVRGINNSIELEVVAEAKDPFEARDAILQYKPDIMTLDIGLPIMNGIEFLQQLLPQYFIPVIVISSLRTAVFDAIEAGAVEFLNKPSCTSAEEVERFIQTDLIRTIKAAAQIKNLKKSVDEEAGLYTTLQNGGVQNKDIRDWVIAIGASTGGTEAIFEIVKKLQPDIPGVIVVQHMPPGFTKMYADRLNTQCTVKVKEAENGDMVLPGQVLIAPGGDAHMRLIRIAGQYKVELKQGPKRSGHCPSVDEVFDSVADVAGTKSIGVLLTGMGADGAKGLLRMRKAGAVTIGQDEASCIVYGMPQVAYQLGAVQYQVALQDIAQKIYSVIRFAKK